MALALWLFATDNSHFDYENTFNYNFVPKGNHLNLVLFLP